MTRQEFIDRESNAWMGELLDAILISKTGDLVFAWLKTHAVLAKERLGLMYDSLQQDFQHAQVQSKQQCEPGAAGKGGAQAATRPARNAT